MADGADLATSDPLITQATDSFDKAEARAIEALQAEGFGVLTNNNIKDLLKIGYPVHKIFWYCGGMQDWENLGLTTVKPKSE